MDFQTVELANGTDVTINAIATALGNTEYTKQKGTPFMKCKLTDANGRMEDVTVWQGKGHPIPGSMQGQTLSFNLSCKVNGQYVNYGGFWNASAQTAPIAAQPTPQGQPQPAQRPNVPQKDDRAEGMVRHGVICAMIEGHCVDYGFAIEYTKFIMTGQIPPEQPINSEDIPF